MQEGGPLSIGKSITLMLFVAMSSVVVGGLAIHDRIGAWNEEVEGDEYAVAVAEVLATQFRPDGLVSGGHVQRALDRFVEHPMVLGASVWDQSGKLTAAAVVNETLFPIVKAPPPLVSRATQVDVARLSVPQSVASYPVRRIDFPLGKHYRSDRPARLTVLVHSTLSSTAPVTRAARFGLPMAALAGTVFLISFWWFRMRVVLPVGSLLTAVTTGKVGDARVSPTTRQDELGAIARCILELYGRANKFQEQAHRIERSLDSRVADETRRIQLDMKKIEREAWRDPLTGVNNRRMLDEKFDAIFEAQKRAGGDLSVIMFDIDHFKTLNDTLGHQAGDELLTFTGELIRQCLRADDSAVRYGGDEFMLILPGVPVEQAQTVAGRVIALFSQRAKLLEVSPKPSMSAGVASQLNNVPNTAKEIIDLADRALYQAKQSGKNTVRICQNLEQLAPLD